MITENLFEGRFMFVDELVRLGADIRIDGHHAVVRGRQRLSGAPVAATDIRAGAGLVLAGLCRRRDRVEDVYHVDRGYPDFVDQLRGLGAEIERTERADQGYSAGEGDGHGARPLRHPRGTPARRPGRPTGQRTIERYRRRRAPPAARAPTPGATAWRSG